MRLYFYAKTGHRVGLDRLRRIKSLIKEFEEYEPLLMVQDFRAADYAKRELGIKRTLGIDDVRNMANVCERGDAVIFDSDEFNESMHAQMCDFFSDFVRISYSALEEPKNGEILINPYKGGDNRIEALLVEKDYLNANTVKKGSYFFYGDEDYEKELKKIAGAFKGREFSLLEGFYFFLDYAKELNECFERIEEIENYDRTIKSASVFVTSSWQSAIESAAAGARTIYLEREGRLCFECDVLDFLGIERVDNIDNDYLFNMVDGGNGVKKEIFDEKNVTKAAQTIKSMLNL